MVLALEKSDVNSIRRIFLATTFHMVSSCHHHQRHRATLVDATTWLVDRRQPDGWTCLFLGTVDGRHFLDAPALDTNNDYDEYYKRRSNIPDEYDNICIAKQ